MYINSTGFYVPAERVDNEYFLNVNGLTSEWIEKRTGIRSRSKASEGEGHNSMGLAAIKDAMDKSPYPIEDVDLIVSASYSPYDTVATLAHEAQRLYNIDRAKAVYASSACSSFVNGLEIVEGYFAMGRLRRQFSYARSIIHIMQMKLTLNAVICGVMQRLHFSFRLSLFQKGNQR